MNLGVIKAALMAVGWKISAARQEQTELQQPLPVSSSVLAVNTCAYHPRLGRIDPLLAPALGGEVVVVEWCVSEDAVGPFDHEGDAVVVPVHPQAFAVGVAVVKPAHLYKVFEFVCSALFTMLHVVDIGPP
jgi:hypothetical protein